MGFNVRQQLSYPALSALKSDLAAAGAGACCCMPLLHAAAATYRRALAYIDFELVLAEQLRVLIHLVHKLCTPQRSASASPQHSHGRTARMSERGGGGTGPTF